MKRKNIGSFVAVQNESVTDNEPTITKNFAVTLSQRDWFVAEFLAENKICRSLEIHINSAVEEFVQQLAERVIGMKRTSKEIDAEKVRKRASKSPKS